VPERNIGLVAQQRSRTVVAGIVHRKEVPDPQRAVMVQEMRQAVCFVAEAEEAENVTGRDLSGAIDHRGKLAAFADSAQQEKLAAAAEFQRQ
jgi:hypothetical protein